MKILYIDDDRMVLEVVGDMLSSLGYHMKLISDPYEAILYSQQKCFDVDVILSDIHMPKMSGTTLVRRIRELHPEVEAIFLTGNNDIVISGKLLRKPCTVGNLEKAIAEIAKRRSIRAAPKSK
jgi:CheY-like chemotaxis protein